MQLLKIAIATLTLVACTTAVREPVTPAATSSAAAVQQREGARFQVDPQRSLVTLKVYRAGTLARIGHNHIIAVRRLSGVVYVPDDLTRASLFLNFAVAELTVDEAVLRSQAGGDFASLVPQTAREGTRRNMLGEGLLDASNFPQINIESQRIDVLAPGRLQAHVQVMVRGKSFPLTVEVQHETRAGVLMGSGTFSLKQTALGLQPFSVMLGALQVQDEMHVSFTIVAQSVTATHPGS
jgi:polyisoprenoid-binding protein YceI